MPHCRRAYTSELQTEDGKMRTRQWSSMPTGSPYFLVLLGDPMKFVADANLRKQALKDIVKREI